MIFKTSISWAMPWYYPSEIPYTIQTLDSLHDGMQILLVVGDVDQFRDECPEAIEMQPGDWDALIEMAAIYPDADGENGFERLQNALQQE